MYPSGLIALGGYLPAKPVPPKRLPTLVNLKMNTNKEKRIDN
jgi:hypothetical protein